MTVLNGLKSWLSTLVLTCGLIMSVGVMAYKVNGIDALATTMHEQDARIAVIEQKAEILKDMRAEDLTLLRNDIHELKESIHILDQKIDRLARR